LRVTKNSISTRSRSALIAVDPPGRPSQRPLFVAALFALKRHPSLSGSRRDPIWRAALAAFGLDTRLALLNFDGFALHRLFDEALGLVAQRLL
jgi:hypothetical protein